jgi:oligoribonuclease
VPDPVAGAQPPLVWIDLEMTGLEPDSCHILEIATIVTDGTLEHRIDGPELVIHHDEDVLAGMNPWCVEHHGQSGLTQRVRESRISLAEAEAQTVAFLREHAPIGRSPLCGNSVELDKAFIDRHMPALSAFLGPHTIDVTALKELARRWYPDVPPFPKNDTHRALDDIVESIGELRFYKTHLFQEPPA